MMKSTYATMRGPSLALASFCFPTASPMLGSWARKQNAGRMGRLNLFNILEKTGAGEEIRTLDPNLGKVVLYH